MLRSTLFSGCLKTATEDLHYVPFLDLRATVLSQSFYCVALGCNKSLAATVPYIFGGWIGKKFTWSFSFGQLPCIAVVVYHSQRFFMLSS